MNEMTFRTKLLTHPQILDNEMIEYLEAYPEKKSLVQNAREFDQTISDALDVDVPEGLHARILLNQSYQQNLDAGSENVEQADKDIMGIDNVTVLETSVSNGTKTGWVNNVLFGSWKMGLAASVMGVAILLGVWQNSQHITPLSGEATIDHIIAHIEHDPSLMTAVKLPNSEQELQQLFANVGAQLSKPVEGMSYAGMCDVEGQQGLHIVMQEQGQPVTIIVMPGQQVEAMQAFHKSGYQGEILPVKGGVVAIVANSMEQVALAQIRFFKAVKFA